MKTTISVHRPAAWSHLWLVLGVALLLFCPALLLPRLVVSEDVAWMDAATGSVKRETRWLVGIRTDSRFEPSALELWLIAQGDFHIETSRRWHKIRGSGKNLWGQRIHSAHGTAPAIDQFPPELMTWFIPRASDEELRALVKEIRSGDEAGQSIAVYHAAKRALELYDSSE